MLPTQNADYCKDPFIVISIHDTAIEWPLDAKESQKAKLEYVATRKIETLNLKPGAEPTKFYLRLLNTWDFTNLEAKAAMYDSATGTTRTNEAMLTGLFFIACVSKVENTVKADGSVIGVLYPKNGERFTPEEINEYFPGPFVISEVGYTAWKRHFLANGIAPRFV